MAIFACMLAILTIAAILSLCRFFNKHGNTRGYPFVGILSTLLFKTDRFHDELAEALEENNGSFLLNCSLFLNRNILVTGHPADARYIFSTRFSNFPKGIEWSKRFDIFGNGSFNTDFDEWMGHRKTIRLLFSNQKFQQLMGKTVQEFITKELIPTLDLVSEQELALDFQLLTKWYTSYFSTYISVGRKPKPVDIYHPEDDQLNIVLGDACNAILLRHLLPVFLWKLMNKLGFGIENKYRKAWETLDSMFAKYASICKEEINKTYGSDKIESHDLKEEDFNALKVYMTGHEIVGGPGTPYNIIRDNVMSLIFAIAESTSTTLGWFFWLISRNPSVEAKIRQELKQVPPIEQCEFKELFMRHSGELNQMVYLEAAINETLRLYPATPYEARTPVHPDTLPSGHHVNEKTTVLISMYGMGRMKSVWGDDSHEFKPERWITEDGKIKYEPPHKFSVFGAGPRICPGKDYSYVLLKTFIASVMQNYHVKVEDNPLTPKASIVLQQKERLMVKIKKIA